MATVRPELQTTIRQQLAQRGDPVRAAGAQRYMKTDEPFYGVRVPEVRKLTHAAVRADPPADLAALVATTRQVWDQAQFREERYAALAILGSPAVRPLLSFELLDLHRYLIVSGAWWDLVDELAHRVGEVRLAWPRDAAAVLRDWARHEDRWLRRCAIISQLQAREHTDLALLTEVIDANAADREFFVRKAIGWALREYARTDPDWVRSFVASRTGQLSPLSVREATKHL